MTKCEMSIAEIILTKDVCSWFETAQSPKFAVLWALWALPSKLNHRFSLGKRLELP